MIRQHKKMILLTSIITLFPIFIGLLLWNQLPDSLATHWGINNEPNGYASKTFAVFGLPLIMLLGHAVSVIAMNIDPKVKNISEKVYFVILWIIPLLSLFVCNVLYGYNLGYQLDMGFLCGLMIGVFYLILGNFIPKVKPNYDWISDFVGIMRSGKLVSHASVWRKMHGDRWDYHDCYSTIPKYVDTYCTYSRPLHFTGNLFLSVLPQILILYHCI